MGLGWGWFPLSTVLLMSSSVIVTYTIAVLEGDVAALFPYISDAGAELPQSAIFAQFLNVAAFTASFSLVIRFWLIMDLTKGEPASIIRAAKVAVVFGVLASFGLSLVGNFQDNKIPAVHFIGAGLTFFLGTTYSFIDTVITYKMSPQYNSRFTGHIRLVISLLGLLGLILTTVGGGIASAQWKNASGDDRSHWKPTDPGYAAHLVSTFGEWIMAFSFILYFFSHVNNFSKIEMTLHLRSLVPHLSLPVTAGNSVNEPPKYESTENTPLLT